MILKISIGAESFLNSTQNDMMKRAKGEEL